MLHHSTGVAIWDTLLSLYILLTVDDNYVARLLLETIRDNGNLR